MKPAIVIPAFSRAGSLERLLLSLNAADGPDGTPLVIAIDRAEERHRAGNKAVIEFARHFRWRHGPLEVIIQPEHLGLVGNVFFCGGLSARYEAILLLEDDLFASRRIYDYAQQALAFYGDDRRVAGLSLNALWFNGFTHQPFIPLLDDGDVFFLKLGTPQGQAYTAEQWAAFAEWMAANDPRVTPADDVHELFAAFPADDWLDIKAKYLAANDKYYVYPRESLTTSFGDAGTHFQRSTALFQVPLQQFRREFRFQTFEEAMAVYDGFYELLPERLSRLSGSLQGLAFDVDLYASKQGRHLQAEYTLTTRRCGKRLATFGKEMRPLEANVIAGVPGAGITLARREDVDLGHASTLAARRDNDDYFTHYRDENGFSRGRRGLLRRLGIAK